MLNVMSLLYFISVTDTPRFACLPWTDVSLSKAALAAEMISKSLPSAGLGGKEAGYSSALLMEKSVESWGYHYGSRIYKHLQTAELHGG